jgi:hypothetical protein
MIFGCISSWLGVVLSPALCFLALNILTGYQTGELLGKKSMNGRWLLAPANDAWPEEVPAPPHREVLE